jgi:hypothetical protein
VGLNEADMRGVTQANASIRRSFDTNYPRAARNTDPDDMQRQYLAFEGARYRFEQARDRSDRHLRGEEDYTPLARNYTEDLARLLADPEFERVTSQLMFGSITPARNPIPVGLAPLLERNEHRPSVFEAVNFLRDFLFERVVEEVVANGSGLRQLLPEQKIGPLQFEVLDGRLVLQHHVSVPSRGRSSNHLCCEGGAYRPRSDRSPATRAIQLR